MSTVVLATSDLHRWLAPVVIAAAGRQGAKHVPVLASVRIQTRPGGHLVAFATDRYRAHVKRVKVTEPPQVDALLSADDVRTLLRLFRPSRRQDPALAVTFDHDGWSVAPAPDETIPLGIPSISFAYHPGEYPKVDHVLAERSGKGSEVTVALNPYFFADFAKAVQCEENSHTPAVLAIGNPVDAVRVNVGDDFRALLMPTRKSNPTEEAWLSEAFPPVKDGAK